MIDWVLFDGYFTSIHIYRNRPTWLKCNDFNWAGRCLDQFVYSVSD